MNKVRVRDPHFRGHNPLADDSTDELQHQGFAEMKHAVEFITGGNARFTLQSKATGTRYTYKVTKAKPLPERQWNNGDMYFVGLLTGPDNTHDYQYIGFFKEMAEGLVAGRKGNPAHPAYKALDWAFKRMFIEGKIPDQLEIFHEGRCGRCARVLTVPESVERGFGPECAQHI